MSVSESPIQAPHTEWFDVEITRGVDTIVVMRRMEAAGWTWHTFAPPEGRHGYRITGRRPIDAMPVTDTFPTPKRVRAQPKRKPTR